MNARYCLMLVCTTIAPRSPPDAGGASRLLPARRPSVDTAAIISLVRQERRQHRLASVSVALARGNSLLLATADGEADVERHTPATPATVYGIASVTKQFTAAAIMKLAEQGLLHLDDPVARYVSPVWPETSGVTVRQLLNHTSGIVSYTDLPAWDSLSTRSLRPEDAVALVRGVPRRFPAGTHWSYSNAGFVLLGIVIERITGRPYLGYLRDEVLAPASLASVRACGEPTTDMARAKGYIVRDGHLTSGEHERWGNIAAAGILCATPTDLVRWEAALDHGLVVSRSALRAMRAPTHIGIGLTVDYGLGTRLGSLDGHPTWGHTGGGQGFTSILLDLPDDTLTIAVITNTENRPAARFIAARIARQVLGLPTFVMHDVPVPPSEIRADTGRWVGDYGPVHVFARGDRLQWLGEGEPGPGHSMPYEGGGTFDPSPDWLQRVVSARNGTRVALQYQGGLFESAAYREAR